MELAWNQLILVGVQAVRCNKRGNVTAGDYISFYGKGNENHKLGNSEQKLLGYHQRRFRRTKKTNDSIRVYFIRQKPEKIT
jgi:hypothetical protein